jgi:hypothetical protein
MHCNLKSVVVYYHARLLLILGPLSFLRLFELPLYGCFTLATVKPRRVRLLLHRLCPCSKLIYVSRRNVTFRPKAALSPLSDGFTGLFHSLVTYRVFYPANMVGC